MTERYDTRTREEIIAEARFDAFRDAPGLDAIPKRELRTFDRFLAHAETRGITAPMAEDFLAFAEGYRSTRRLEDLRLALDRLAPEGAAIREDVRMAIRTKRGSVRPREARSRAQLADDPLMAPYRDLPAFAQVPLEDLRVLARFLAHAEARGVETPSTSDYLAFCEDVSSSRRLRSLKTALDALLPGNPAVHVVLAEAIALKSPERKSRKGTKPRPAAARRVAADELPAEWRGLLGKMRMGIMPGGRRAPAASVIDSLHDVLRQYAHVRRMEGRPMTITIQGVRALASSCADHAAARDEAAWSDQGNRPATRHTVVSRLRLFAEALQIEPLVIAALRHHERTLRREMNAVVPLKHGRLTRMPDLRETWALAQDLLRRSAGRDRRQTALRLANEGAVLALWTFLPLRLADGRLRWGEDIAWDGSRWRVELTTQKAKVPLQGRLHPRLTPFLDALVLRGLDPAWLEEMRARSGAERLPVLRDVDDRMLAKGYPSKVWRTHMGTGAHIARTRIHTELGQLGAEGVECALALCAQSDPRTAQAYQGAAMRRSRQQAGQDMIDALLDELAEDADRPVSGDGA